MWRFVEGLPEEPDEVVTGETGLIGDLVEIDWLAEVSINKTACATQSPVGILIESNFMLSAHIEWRHQ